MKAANPFTMRIDFLTLAVMALLIGIGMVMIYSSSIEVARMRYNAPQLFLVKQVVRFLLAFVLFYLFLNLDYHVLAEKYKVFLIVAAAMLLILIVSNSVAAIKGSRRWISLFGLNIQPSDLARVALIVYAARMLAKNGELITDTLEGLVTFLAVPGLMCVLIVLQPNFSTALIIALVMAVMLFSAGLRMSWVGFFAVAGAVLAAFVAVKAPYRIARLKAFMDPEASAAGYQALQSLIGLGSGGVTGVGLGGSSQKFLYLPEAYTDFVFSILGEEMGFLGVLAVLILFAVLIWRGFRIGLYAPDKLGFFLAVGITSMIGLYLFVHSGVVSALLPTTGIPMPFLSYGGSSLLFNMIAMGILLNISSQAKR